jgi:hypothetical protein
MDSRVGLDSDFSNSSIRTNRENNPKTLSNVSELSRKSGR